MTSAEKDRRLWVLWALVLAGFVVAFRGLAGTIGADATGHVGSTTTEVEDVFFSAGESSPVLIAVISAWFMFRRLPRFRASLVDPSRPVIASMFFASAAAIVTWAHYVSADELLVPAFSFALLGSAALLGGNEALRAVRLPALFLWLAIPIPAVVLNPFMYSLQTVTAQTTAAILRLPGLEAISFGEMVWFRGSVFQVVETCSGLRATLTLLMTAFVYAEALDRSHTRTTCLVVMSPVIGLLINELRVLSIVLNPHSELAGIHSAQGIVMIVVGVLILALVDWAIGKIRPESSIREDPPIRPAAAPATAGLVQTAAFAIGLAAITLVVEPWEAPEKNAPPVSSLPGQWRGWVERGRLPVDREFLGSIYYDHCMVRKYNREGSKTEIMMCIDHRLKGGNRMLSEKMRLPGPGWEIEDSGVMVLEPQGRTVDYRALGRGRQKQLSISWQIGAASTATEILRGVLSLDRGPLHRPERAISVRISTEVESDDPLQAKARRRLVSFVSDFSEPLSTLGAL